MSQVLKLMKSFSIDECRIVISDEDETWNARWYWLRFFPFTGQCVQVNFLNDSYLRIAVSNRLYKIIYAFMR